MILMIMAVPVFAQDTRAMFIAMDAQDVHWLKLNQGAQAAAAKAKIYYTMQAPHNKVDTSQQIAIMENAITSGYNIILVAPQQANSMIATINKARAAGIKVIVVDSPLPAGSQYDAFIGTPNGAASRAAADELAKAIGSRGKIAIVNAQAGAGTTMLRENEFKAQIAEKYPNITIVGTQYCNGDPATAQNQATDFMRANPDLVGFYACNEGATKGVGAAVKQAGKAGAIKVVGWDVSNESKAFVMDGSVLAIVAQNPAAMGTKGIEAGLALMAGKTVKKDDDSGFIMAKRNNIGRL